MKSLPRRARHIGITVSLIVLLLLSTGLVSAAPDSTPNKQPLMPVELPEAQNQVHVVRWGETLGSIARRYGVTITALAQANGIVNINLIYVGQSLVIPTGTGGTTPAPTPAPGTPPSQESNTVHVVSSGETLTRISIRYGVTVQAIMSANGLFNPNLIYVGQTLNIPGTTVTNPNPGTNPTPVPNNPNPPQAPAILCLAGKRNPLRAPTS